MTDIVEVLRAWPKDGDERPTVQLTNDAAKEIERLRAKLERNNHANPYELYRDGGPWLGAARRYLKWNVRGGDWCTWSSEEPLTLTVRQIEELAAHAVFVDRGDEE